MPHIDLNQYKNTSSASELDKTISQIQKQLDSVSASLAETSSIPLLAPVETPNSETDKLLKTIMEGNIVNQNVEVMGDMGKRDGGVSIHVKMEEEEEGDEEEECEAGEVRNSTAQQVLQHSDRIEQLMNTLNNHNTSVVSTVKYVLNLCLSIYLSFTVYLSLCLSIYLSFAPSIFHSIYRSATCIFFLDIWSQFFSVVALYRQRPSIVSAPLF